MKKILTSFACAVSAFAFSQFSVNIEVDPHFKSKEIYLYALDGSKDILLDRIEKVNNKFVYKHNRKYSGMLKAYVPEINFTFGLISENKGVSIKLVGSSNVPKVEFLDEANRLMNVQQDQQKKQEHILPVLTQMLDYYQPNADFYKALKKEIESLSQSEFGNESFPFVHFYNSNYKRYLFSGSEPTKSELINFLVNSSELLETSSLLRPTLITYLNHSQHAGNIEQAVDELLSKANVETPRGQNLLSEFIEIFDVYSMTDMKDKYLANAKNLKCTINNRLSSTIETNAKTAVGAKFENYRFHRATHTKAKTLYDVKADRKIIVFWSSSCSHCEKDLPEFIPYMKQLEAQNIQIIGFSLDTDLKTFENKAKNYPWINDTELKGWYSTVNEKYNVHATPSYYILDKNNVIIDKPDRAKNVLEYLGIK